MRLLSCGVPGGHPSCLWPLKPISQYPWLPPFLDHSSLSELFLFCFVFNIARVSPLTLHIIDRARKLMKFKSKFRSFRLEFYTQRQDLWAYFSFELDVIIIVIFWFSTTSYHQGDEYTLIAILKYLQHFHKVDIILLSYLVYKGKQGLLLLKTLFKVIQKVVELVFSQSSKQGH